MARAGRTAPRALFDLEDLRYATDIVIVLGLVIDLSAVAAVKLGVPVLDPATIAFLRLGHIHLVHFLVVQEENVEPVEALPAVLLLAGIDLVVVVPAMVLASVPAGRKSPIAVLASVRFLASMGPLMHLEIGFRFEDFATNAL